MSIRKAKAAVKIKSAQTLAKLVYPLIKPVLAQDSSDSMLFWDARINADAPPQFFIADPFRVSVRGIGTELDSSLERDFGVCANYGSKSLVLVAALKVNDDFLASLIKNQPYGLYNTALVVFDKKHFYHIDTSTYGKLSIKAQYKWTDAGGASILRGLISTQCRDPTLDRVRKILREQLNAKIKAFTTVQLVTNNVSEYTPRLGEGHYGQAILVCSCDDAEKLFVLKFCERTGEGATEWEYKNLLERYAACPEHVIKPVEGSYRTGSGYESYLMAERGTAIESPVSVAMVKKLLTALYALHKAGFFHGSCRLDNAVLVDGKVKWIDMRRGSPPFAELIGADVCSLLNSISRYNSCRSTPCISSTATAYGEYVLDRLKEGGKPWSAQVESIMTDIFVRLAIDGDEAFVASNVSST